MDGNAGANMGPVAREMLRSLSTEPNGERGFRAYEVSQSAVREGWVRYTWESGRIVWYAITDAGRKAFKDAEYRRRSPP